MAKYTLQVDGKDLTTWDTPWELGYGHSVYVLGMRYVIIGYDPVKSIVFLQEAD